MKPDRAVSAKSSGLCGTKIRETINIMTVYRRENTLGFTKRVSMGIMRFKCCEIECQEDGRMSKKMDIKNCFD